MNYDLAIIGAGVSGLATAMYAARLKLKTICFGSMAETEMPIGGIITLTDSVENYPGIKNVTGEQLAKKIHEHVLDYDVDIKEQKVTKIKKNADGCFNINNEHNAKAICFATGAKWRKLSMPGAKELEGRGVQYCALCDAPLYKDKIVAIVGGSDSAAKESLLLSKYAKKVYIIHRGEKIRAEPINLQLVKENNKIEILTNTQIKEIVGQKAVEKIILDNNKEIELQGVFGAIGHIPLSELAKSLGVNLNNKGEIITDKNSHTNIPGIYAAGDITDFTFKQAITGVAQGVTAAHSAYEYITENEFVCPLDDEIYRQDS